MSDSFIITEEAAAKILELGHDPSGQMKRLRITVEGGGCSGFRYNYEFGCTLDSNDLVFHGKGGAEVIIDDLSITFLQESVLDYVEELGSAGFEIKNPQAKAKCGCGNSFAV